MPQVEKQFGLETEAVRFIRERESAYAPPISRRLLSVLRGEMVRGVTAGERVGDIVKRVRKILSDQGPFRALKIVRTEVVGAFNRGTIENYKQNDAIKMKEWLTARDANVRPTKPGDFDHRSSDTQRRPVTDPFTVSGESLMHPGDPRGSPGNIINCRCTMTPVTAARAAEGQPQPGAAIPPGARSSSAINTNIAGDFENAWMAEFEAEEKANIKLKQRRDLRAKSIKRISKKVARDPGALALINELDAEDMDGVVSRFSEAWSNTSGDNNALSVAFQLAVKEEFGLATAAVNHYGVKTLSKARALLGKHRKVLRRITREVYNDTQRWLKKKGFKEVTLYRGTSKRAMPFAKPNGAVGESTFAPLTSFSTNTDDAGRFVDSFTRTADGPAIAATHVPASEVFTTPVQGFGVATEAEVIMLGGQRNMVAATVDLGVEIEEQIDELRQILAQAGGGVGDI